MKKKMNKVITLIMVTALICTAFSSMTFASEDALQAYRNELEVINKELGTSYRIITEQEVQDADMTYDDVIRFYQSMTMGEFKDYILQLHDMDKDLEQTDPQLTYEGSENSLARGAELCTNFFHYNSIDTITVLTYNIKINGTSYFQSVLRCNGSKNSYPCYVPIGATYTPSSDSTQLTCKFRCNKYLSSTVTDGTIYNLSTTFTAQYGGSVTGNTFSSSGVVKDSGVRLRNYPNTSSTVLELMYAPETVSVDTANSTMTFYRVRRNSTGTIGFVSKDYITLTQPASLDY